MLFGRRRPRLLLVNPSRKSRYNWDMLEMCRAMGRQAPTVPLALPLAILLSSLMTWKVKHWLHLY